jgi:quercetin dioxygenase-like cupin family protein
VSPFADLPEITPYRIWDGVRGRVVEGEQVTFVVVELDPGAAVPEHAHPNEQVGVLAKGSMRFRIGDEERDLEAGGTWQIPPNVSHEVTAGPDGAIAVELFVPARADWDALEREGASAPLWP